MNVGTAHWPTISPNRCCKLFQIFPDFIEYCTESALPLPAFPGGAIPGNDTIYTLLDRCSCQSIIRFGSNVRGRPGVLGEWEAAMNSTRSDEFL